MRYVKVGDLEEGMVLHRDLVAANGRLLLSRGTEIRKNHIRIMKIWGIVEASISDNLEQLEKTAADGIDGYTARKIEDAVDHKFSLTNCEHEAIAELRNICASRMAARPGTISDHTKKFANLQRGSDISSRFRLRNEITPETLVQRHLKLVSLPSIYFRIQKVINDPRSSSFHIADVVSKDSSLAANLLKLVNSSFYGFPSKIESVSRAVALIGTNELSTLALGISVVNHFRNIPSKIIDMNEFWKHSIACGIFSRILAHYKIGLSEERFFMAGLLHDIGRLAMLIQIPEKMAVALHTAAMNPMIAHQAEREIVGFDHTLVAHLLLREWKLPGSFEMIRNHHSPEKALNTLEPSILQLADIMAISMGIGYGGTFFVPEMGRRAWEILDLSPAVLHAATVQADRQMDEIFSFFI